MPVLVTGGAGFIGSRCCERLLEQGREVVCLDCLDDTYDPALKRANLAAARDHAGFRLVEGDVRDADLLADLLGEGGPWSVLHLAARPGPRASVRRPREYFDVNTLGTVTLLHACAEAGAGQVVIASSSSVYGAAAAPPFREDAPLDRPASPYAASKAAAELAAHAVAHTRGLPVTVARLFTVYGPRQRPDMAIATFARRILAGEPLDVYGDGTSTRDYTYVEDAADALLAMLARPVSWDVFNVASGHRVPLSAVLDGLESELGRPAERRHVPPPPGDLPATGADLTHARDALGYAPRVPFEQGLHWYCAWLTTSAG